MSSAGPVADDSDTCWWECAEGYESVNKAPMCSDLCCTIGRPGPFWYDACWFECPSGFESVYKAPTCWDLCVPIGQPFDLAELTNVPVSDKGRVRGVG